MSRRNSQKFSLILMIFMFLSVPVIISTSARPAQATLESTPVSTEQELREAIELGGTQIITLTANITVEGTGFVIPEGVDITLEGAFTITHVGTPVTTGFTDVVGFIVVSGLAPNAGRLTINGVHIERASAYYSSGIVLLNHATLTLASGSIRGFHATEGGGVTLLGLSRFTMYDGAIYNNRAFNGGGVNSASSVSTFVMRGGEIRNNHAYNNGGGIFSDEIHFEMHGGIIRNNEATHMGGGLFFDPYSSSIPMHGNIEIRGGKILGNKADYGGGIFVFDPEAILDITDETIFQGNIATGQGGAIYTRAITYDYSTIETLSNIIIGSEVEFRDNTANASIDPAAIHNLLGIFPNVHAIVTSVYGHPVNNYDINHPDSFPIYFYRIAYFANNGTTNYHIYYLVSTEEYYNYIVHSIAMTGFSRAGYVFTGWNTEADRSGYAFVEGEVITLYEDTNLYAQWEPVPSLPPLPPLPSELHSLYMIGDQHGAFRPTANITRAEVAVILARTQLLDFAQNVQALPPGMGSFEAFADVNFGDWHYYYIAWAYGAGLVQGVGGYFRPNDPITREEVAAMMARMGTILPAGDLSGFGDANAISGWARDYVYTVHRAGLMIGDGGLFRPNARITRAEIATATNRTLGRVDSPAALEVVTVVNLPDARRFPDVSESAWYFPSVLAAANDHRLTRGMSGNINWIEFARD